MLLARAAAATTSAETKPPSRMPRTPPRLLPLDGRGRLRGDVVHDAVDAPHFIGDPAGDLRHQVVRESRPVRGHPVEALHRAQHAGRFVGALVAHHAHAAHRQEHRERLPEPLPQPGVGDLLLYDGVGLAHDLQAVLGDLAEDPDGEAGPGERLARDDRLGQAQLAPERAHLVLEQLAERLDQLHAHPLRQPPHVVVALDHLAGSLEGDALDHVRVESALGEEARVAVLGPVALHLLLEDGDELVADDLTLALGIDHAAQLLQETRPGVDRAQRQVEPAGEGLLDLLGLPFAEQAVVDEDALELRADGPVQEQGDNGAVHPAGEGADDALLPPPVADAGRRVLDDRAHTEAEADPALLEERLIQLPAAGSVGHLGMELDGVQPLLRVGDRAEGRVLAAPDDAEAARGGGHLVPVAHPDVEVLARAHLAEGPHRLNHLDARVSVLAVRGAVDGAAEQLGHELQAVADPEYGDAHLEHRAVDERGAGLLDAEGAAGEDDPARPEGADLLDGHRTGVDLAVDVELADAPGDELRVLRPEIEDEDLFCVQVGHSRPSSAGGAL